ncbi:MAG: hypothetical protein U0132_19730 [Gemmatimonadaceae bacterium]
MVREIALRARRTSVLAVLGLAAVTARPAVAHGQLASESTDSSARVQRAATAPTSEAARPLPGPRVVTAGFTRAETNASDATPQKPANNVHAGENLALMGAGGAAVIVGLLIGGDGGHLLALGGGVVGIFGLFRYLR